MKINVMTPHGLSRPLLVAGFVLCFSLCACADTFTGTIVVKGSHPHTGLFLVTDQGDMAIVGILGDRLRACCQGRRVTLRGEIVSHGAFGIPPELKVTAIVRESVP